MSPRPILARPKRPRDTGRDIYIPHSSWSRKPRTTADAVIAPEDFWAKLGI